jgi:hypothetical protein
VPDDATCGASFGIANVQMLGEIVARQQFEITELKGRVLDLDRGQHPVHPPQRKELAQMASSQPPIPRVAMSFRFDEAPFCQMARMTSRPP